MASWDEGKQMLNVWLSTQAPQGPRRPRDPRVSEKNIRVVAPDVGGAFGGKASLYPDEAMVASRRCGSARPCTGVPAAARNFSRRPRPRRLPPGEGGDAEGSAGPGSHPRFTLGHWMPYSAAVPARMRGGSCRAPSVGAVDIARHGVARACAGRHLSRGGAAGGGHADGAADGRGGDVLSLDPLELRRRNLSSPTRCPSRHRPGKASIPATIFVCSIGGASRAGRDVLDARGSDRLRHRHGALRRALRQRFGKRGGLYPARRSDRAATGSSAQGQGRVTSYRQIVADVLRQAAEHPDRSRRHRPVRPASGRLPAAPPRSAAARFVQAAEQFREKARQFAARVLHDPGSVALTENGVEIRHPVRRGLAWHRLARIAYADSEIVAEFGEGLAHPTIYEAEGEAWSSGCCIAGVSIDRDTGRWLSIASSGSTMPGRSSIRYSSRVRLIGGMAQGIGEAMMERIVYDEDGQLLPARSWTMPFRAPVISRMSKPEKSKRRPVQHLGAKGVGEAGCVGMPAAIVNAVVRRADRLRRDAISTCR